MKTKKNLSKYFIIYLGLGIFLIFSLARVFFSYYLNSNNFKSYIQNEMSYFFSDPSLRVDFANSHFAGLTEIVFENFKFYEYKNGKKLIITECQSVYMAMHFEFFRFQYIYRFFWNPDSIFEMREQIDIRKVFRERMQPAHFGKYSKKFYFETKNVSLPSFISLFIPSYRKYLSTLKVEASGKAIMQRIIKDNSYQFIAQGFLDFVGFEINMGEEIAFAPFSSDFILEEDKLKLKRKLRIKTSQESIDILGYFDFNSKRRKKLVDIVGDIDNNEPILYLKLKLEKEKSALALLLQEISCPKNTRNLYIVGLLGNLKCRS